MCNRSDDEYKQNRDEEDGKLMDAVDGEISRLDNVKIMPLALRVALNRAKNARAKGHIPSMKQALLELKCYS